MKRSLIAFLFAFSPLLLFSQSETIPLDENVKIGKLENGFTYYLRKNNYPENRVQFRLAVDAGSMQEDDDQLGVAHFVEHMAFNGIENFEKNELTDFLQSVGVEFGADLNAYTSFEETIYMLPLPTDDFEIIEKGFTVLEDWASGLLFDSEEIDKERGIVVEEWRTGQGAQERMRKEYFPVLFKDSRYAKRLPIGTKQSIETVSYDRIKDFYKDWYRPELMALIVVGDIDLSLAEKEIKSRFAKLKNPTEPRQKMSNEVPDHKETLVAITKDKENSFTSIQLVYKQDLQVTSTLSDFRKLYLQILYNQMLSQRLQELTQTADPPFIFGSSSYGGFVRAKDNYSSFAVVGENGVLAGLEALVIENERVKKHGFTSGELKRAIQNLEISLESATKELGKTESASYAAEYIRHFLEKEPSPGIQFEYEFFKEIAPTIKLEEINALANEWITEENRVIIVTGIDKEGVVLPSEEEILKTLNEVDIASIEPYEDLAEDQDLITDAPSPGKVISQSTNETTGTTELTLSNGVKVVVKETDFKNDEILMSAFSLGGHSIYKDEDYQTATMASTIISQGGIKDINLIDLGKMLSGKNVNISPYIGSLREGLNGNSTPKDFETLLQLTYLYFMEPRKDETAFQSIISRNKMLFENIMANPDFFYRDRLSRIMSQNHLRGGGFPTPEEMDQVDLDRAFEIYQDRFANAGDFTFFFIGNLDLAESIPLFETYLGSLPSIDRNETWRDVGVRPPEAPLDEKIYKGSEDKSIVTVNFKGEKELNKKQRYLFRSLGEVIEIKLDQILREAESGVYGANASGGYSKRPYENYTFNISFQCAPENVDKLIGAAFEEIRKIQTEGVLDEDVTKIRESQTKNREENIKRNRFWLNQLNAYYYNESDLDSFFEVEDFTRELNGDDLQAIAKDLIDLDKPIKIILYPENGE